MSLIGAFGAIEVMVLYVTVTSSVEPSEYVTVATAVLLFPELVVSIGVFQVTVAPCGNCLPPSS
ncbi:hypothetical protein TZ96_00494 [Streptococcus infantis]|uniref:Uncharacterized protein n=1 Tax=Streptococcus infantis TaxID=68892 RepID=A0A0F3HKH9_9STRE|nr:hypothetical protein TZ96_00494 [Streptococcus infantis]